MLELTTYTELEIMHRLGGAYSGRCLHPHGHRYEVEITVTAQRLNEDGMIVDFKKLKEVVKTVLDDKWDHGACVRVDDPLARPLMEDAHHERVHAIAANPTLEWMVEYWVQELQEALGKECPGVGVSRLKASETARNTVTWHCECLPWQKATPVDEDDATQAICAEERDERKVAHEAHRLARAQLVPAPQDEHTIRVDTEEDNPDSVLYLVEFRNGIYPYSTTVHTACRGDSLLRACARAINSVKLPDDGDGKHERIILGITKLPE